MEEKRHIIESGNSSPYVRPDYDFILSDIDAFKKDKRLFFIYKKTTRLVSALHLLANLLLNDEPLKRTLKDFSLKIIPLILSPKNSFGGRNELFKEIELNLLKVGGHIETAYFSGLISEMNSSLILKEVRNLINIVEDYFNNFYSEKADSYLENLIWTDKGHNKGQENIKDKTINTALLETQTNIKRQVLNKTDKIETQVFNQNKSNRQVEIIGIIKDKRTVSIKDVSEIIKDCSEKTIQRELLAMVESGVLKKEGERRWSRYSLNL